MRAPFTWHARRDGGPRRGPLTSIARRADGNVRISVLGRSGAVRRTLAVALPSALHADPRLDFDWAGDSVLVAGASGHALVRVRGRRATAVPVSLASGAWELLSPGLVFERPSSNGFSQGRFVRVDPATGRVLATASTPPADDDPDVRFESVLPYAGGAIVGGGRLRFDRALQVAASDPRAVPVSGPRAVRRGDRLYVRTYSCFTRDPTTVRIVDAGTLTTITTRPLDAVGVLGGGRIEQGFVDECD